MLTEGYAHALDLERRLRRIDREMADLAARAYEEGAMQRLRRLATEGRTLQISLNELRDRLRRLKDSADYTSRERTA